MLVDYRLYLFGGTGHIIRAIELMCTDDAHAARAVIELRPAHPSELWRRAQMIQAFQPFPPETARQIADDLQADPVGTSVQTCSDGPLHHGQRNQTAAGN